MRRTILTAALLGLLLLPRWGGNLEAANTERRPVVDVATAGPVKTAWEAAWGGYTLSIVPAGQGACFRILQHGREVYHVDGEGFAIAKAVEDIDGNGVVDIVISEWTGAGHRDQRLHILELGTRLRHVATVAGTHAATARFEDLDGDGRMELLTHDWTFANWRTSFADSPAPDVVLRFSKGAYRPAWSLMRRAAPDVAAAAAKLVDDPAWAQNEVPPALLATMLDWTYAGQGAAAEQLLAATWPVTNAEKRDAFWRSFQAQLVLSPYVGH